VGCGSDQLIVEESSNEMDSSFDISIVDESTNGARSISYKTMVDEADDVGSQSWK
jgi:hypothetical protein